MHSMHTIWSSMVGRLILLKMRKKEFLNINKLLYSQCVSILESIVYAMSMRLAQYALISKIIPILVHREELIK